MLILPPLRGHPKGAFITFLFVYTFGTQWIETNVDYVLCEEIGRVASNSGICTSRKEAEDGMRMTDGSLRLNKKADILLIVNFWLD